jgi:hypothetical protein
MPEKTSYIADSNQTNKKDFKVPCEKKSDKLKL